VALESRTWMETAFSPPRLIFQHQTTGMQPVCCQMLWLGWWMKQKRMQQEQPQPWDDS
jgi:hypothetical protein